MAAPGGSPAGPRLFPNTGLAGLISRHSDGLTVRDGTPKAPRTPKVQPRADPANEEPHTPNPGSLPAHAIANRAPDAQCLIVGIGGSAGSLSPLRELVTAIPVDSGMSFVVVSHQPPTGHSMLPEILAKCTEMPVLEITAEVRAEQHPSLPHHSERRRRCGFHLLRHHRRETQRMSRGGADPGRGAGAL